MNLSSEHYEFVNNKESPSEGTRNVESFNAENDSEDEDGSSEGRESVAAKIRRENAVASLVHDGSFQETSRSRCERSSLAKRENEHSETKSQVKRMNRLHSINRETLKSDVNQNNDTNEVSLLSETLSETSLESTNQSAIESNKIFHTINNC